MTDENYAANAISCSPSPRVATPIPTARRKGVITIEKVSGIATANVRGEGFRESKYRAGSRMGMEGGSYACTALACLLACVRASPLINIHIHIHKCHK